MSEHLRALALAAVATESSPNYHEHERAFEYAATPAAILALLDELEDSHKAYALLFKENAELRKDADRYLWLRNEAQWLFDVPQAIIWKQEGHPQEICAEDELDEAIDAAIDSAAKGESNA